MTLFSQKKIKPKWAAFFSAILAVALIIPILHPLRSAAQQSPAIQFVSPAWLAEHTSDPKVHVLDVRINPLEYIGGHIPGAVHIADNTFRGPNGRLPIQYWELDKLQSLFVKAGINSSDQVVVYSDGANILGSTMTAYLLERSGHAKVAVLDGGLKGYKDAGFSLTKEFPQYADGNFTLKDDASIRVSLDEVRNLIGKSEITFIDPRPPALYAGEIDLFIRNGHIPGAKNIPWQSFTIGEDNLHQLKSLDEIKAILAKRGITPEDNIIVTCSTGREATLQYVALKHLLGYPKVRIYEGSWTEYSSQPDLPIATGQDPELV
ncbi:sulfurtransferase [Synechococcales cyanobacterium C]|uniref:Sulfurtransferase n=1 Tax=Petrachloros mirabilis ULC683 TaxID=2781853 RepID=A0A8K2A9I5_9CYAN|nr:sulfurtransferase [Petrachloros mirabilis]NCJ08304.1 sulfurtransferase [Petrachloros mirabilis ULC683]